MAKKKIINIREELIKRKNRLRYTLEGWVEKNNDQHCFVDDDKVDLLLGKVKRVYQYDRTDFWIPIEGSSLKKEFDYFYIMKDVLEPYLEDVIDVLFEKHSQIYFVPLYSDDQRMYLFNRKEFDNYQDVVSEYFCFPKDLSWAYYHCHEGSITFAGAITKKIKKLTLDIEKSWNVYTGA